MKKVIFLLLIGLILFNPLRVEAKEKFVLFIMDGVSLSEIEAVETPNLDRLITQGAIGLMNTRTAGSLEPKDAYLTIGASDRARVGRAGYKNFNFNEKVDETTGSQLYLRRNGRLKDGGEILNTELVKIISTNRRSSYQAKVGHLGSVLEKKDLKVTILGNADIFGQRRRQIALLGINKYGVVKQGDVGLMMSKKSVQYPSGYITDQKHMLVKLDQYCSESDLIVIESGDTSRIEAISNVLMAEKFDEAKKMAIARVDKLLGEVMKRVDLKEDYLMVLIPTSSKEGIANGNKLTLALLDGSGIDGLLTSNTTRRAGLITNLDIAPTIYSYLSGEDDNFTGRKISSQPSNKGFLYLKNLNRKIRTTFRWRPVLLKGFILLQIITLILVGLILIKQDNFSSLKKVAIYLLLILLWIPLCFLVSKFFVDKTIVFALLVWIGFSFLAVYGTLKLENNLMPIIIPSLVVSGALLVDLWWGARLIKLSVLGYSPVIGARFYGIGNEYMGIFIGAGVIGLTALSEVKKSLRPRFLGLLLILLTMTVGHPRLGANFGGLITATVVSLVVYFNLKKEEFDLRLLLKLGFILGVVILGIIIIDTKTGSGTHLAHTLEAIKRGGVTKLVAIIYRKLGMNLKLLRWTIWSRVLLGFVIILIILFKRPRGKIRRIINNYPNLSSGFRGLLAGSVTTMLVNDSGVVAAATLLLFPVFTLLYLVLGDDEAFFY